MSNNQKTRLITSVAVLSALAYILSFLNIKMFGFLTLDVKDVITVIAGFIFGPLASLGIGIVVPFAEMITTSETGVIGFVMNSLASISFSVSASYIYHRNKTLKNAIIGLITGTLLLILVMVLWNIFLTPIFLGVTREEVLSLIFPVFVPFNLLKGTLITALTLIVYKPIVKAARAASLLPKHDYSKDKTTKNTVVLVLSLIVIAMCVLYVLLLNGII